MQFQNTTKLTWLSADSWRHAIKHYTHVFHYKLWYFTGYVAWKWANERYTYRLVRERLLLQQGKSGFSLTQIFQSGSEPHPDPIQSVPGVLSLRNFIFAKEIFIFAINNAFVASRRHGPRYLSCTGGADKSLARPNFPMYFVLWWKYFVWCYSCYVYK